MTPSLHHLKMFHILTVSCQLITTPQQVEKLELVLKALARCCEFVHRHTPENLHNCKEPPYHPPRL
ncbi:hypothetical protein NW851_11755 [Synechococcus sp. H55.7]|uniref:hypothetical protein n=1 Tax=unclassified Synechococcus TaxID=2626047 RepID=UPI0039C2870F